MSPAPRRASTRSTTPSSMRLPKPNETPLVPPARSVFQHLLIDTSHEGGLVRTTVAMDTLVTIQVAGPITHGAASDAAIERALDWFHAVERCCSRFDPASEVTALAARAGAATQVSTMLF